MQFNISLFLEISQVPLKSKKHVGYFTKRPICIYHYIFSVNFELGEVLSKLGIENREVHSQHKHCR